MYWTGSRVIGINDVTTAAANIPRLRHELASADQIDVLPATPMHPFFLLVSSKQEHEQEEEHEEENQKKKTLKNRHQ